MRRVYAGRLAALRNHARQELAGALEIPDVEAGVNIVGWLAKGLSAQAVAMEAAAQGVEVLPLTAFRLQRDCCLGLERSMRAK